MTNKSQSILFKVVNKFNVNIVETEYFNIEKSNEESLNQLYILIGTDTIELVHIIDNLFAVIDENGKMKSNQPIMELTIHGVAYEFVGNVVLLTIENDDFADINCQFLNKLQNTTCANHLITKYTN